MIRNKPAVSVKAQDYINSRFDGQRVTETIDHNFLLNVGDALKKNNGAGVTVGILDHPISAALKFKNPVERPFSAGEASSNHANFIAGLAAGADGIGGIANEVKLLELPVYDSDGYVLSEGELQKLCDHLLSREECLILNISQKLAISLRPKLEQIAVKHIVIACAGIDIELEALPRFPASLENVIAVGCVSNEFLAHKVNRKVDILVPDLSFVSYDVEPGKYVYGRGDSFSCAIVTAIAALLLSVRKKLSVSEMRKEIIKTAQAFTNPGCIDLLNPIIPNQ